MKIPHSTYRIQFTPDFGFQKAKEISGYLYEIGISDLYASPVFKAKKGSPHGYDVVDQNQLNPDLGTENDFEELVIELKKYGIGWIQDVVPNHMAFDGENPMLMDVLENGHNSEYFDFFAIEWNHFSENMSQRLLAPFLGRHYGESLDAGEITLCYDQNGFYIQYYSLKLPLKIESYVRVITNGLPLLREKLGDDNPDLVKFLGILYSLKNLPDSQEERLGRYSQIQFVKSILWELYSGNSDIKDVINENLCIFNGEDGPGADFNLLDSLLSEQLFRLSFWKVATEELNYRRFFNINGLISLRIEDEKVFSRTHLLVFRLLKERKISGLRIDHIDGLYDPAGYLRNIRERAEDAYLITEKILEHNEDLPSLWPAQGTTGYDFMNYVNGIFCMENNGREFNKLFYKFTGFKTSYDVLFYEKKKLVIETDMTGDVDNLAHQLKKVSSRDRYGSDITLYGVKRAIVEILAFFPVYRTYIRDDNYSTADRNYIREAVEKARDANPALFHEINFIERFLLLEFNAYSLEEDKKEWVHFVMCFQQVSGPLMAKGVEDTILYIYNRLLSLNEVGGSPDRFGISATEFHEFNLRRLRRQPHTMNATATHDTKRGEDIRARINVLSEMPSEWEAHLRKWSRLNRRKKKAMKGVVIPDKNDEYFLYQTMLGAFPFNIDEMDSFRSRLKEYIIKAVREAKVHTAWLKPDTDYEENFMAFIDKILTPSDKNLFLEDFTGFQKKIAWYGIFNSLSQTLLKITSPGIPDFYQGTELWDLNFVDPDNRRPVDYSIRQWLFREMKAREAVDGTALIKELFATKEDGRLKLFLIYKALAVRNKLAILFEKGEYVPLETAGEYADNLLAFARVNRPLWGVVMVPRFLTGVAWKEVLPIGRNVWGDTHVLLPDDAPSLWHNKITGESLTGTKKIFAGDAFKYFPGALIVSKTKNDR